jgi:hypothetical protein
MVSTDAGDAHARTFFPQRMAVRLHAAKGAPHRARSAVCGLLRRGKADLRGQGCTGYDNSMLQRLRRQLSTLEGRPDGVTLRTIFDRLETVEDPWKDFRERAIALTKARWLLRDRSCHSRTIERSETSVRCPSAAKRLARQGGSPQRKAARRLALIRIAKHPVDSAQKQHWLLIKERDQNADPAWSIDSPAFDRSVLTRPTLSDIARGRPAKIRHP